MSVVYSNKIYSHALRTGYEHSNPSIITYTVPHTYKLWVMQPRNVDSMLGSCWATVYDAGPTSTQYCINVTRCWTKTSKYTIACGLFESCMSRMMAISPRGSAFPSIVISKVHQIITGSAPQYDECLFCETQWRHSVQTRLYKNPPPYFIVLASSVKTQEVEVIEFHRILRRGNYTSVTSS